MEKALPPVPHHPKPKGTEQQEENTGTQRERERERRGGKGRKSLPRPADMADEEETTAKKK